MRKVRFLKQIKRDFLWGKLRISLIYLAVYDLYRQKEGRACLKRKKKSPLLMRLCIENGIEDMFPKSLFGIGQNRELWDEGRGIDLEGGKGWL